MHSPERLASSLSLSLSPVPVWLMFKCFHVSFIRDTILLKVSLRVIFVYSLLSIKHSHLIFLCLRQKTPPNLDRDPWPALIPAQGRKDKSEGEEAEERSKTENLIGWGVFFFFLNSCLPYILNPFYQNIYSSWADTFLLPSDTISCFIISLFTPQNSSACSPSIKIAFATIERVRKRKSGIARYG